MRAEETIDELRLWNLRLIQQKHGYRFSLDPLLLCDFVHVQPGDRIIDLGAGCGIIPLVLARKSGDGTGMICGIEKQQVLADAAERNVRLNSLDGRVTILHDDLLFARQRFKVSSFDLVTANPPYRSRGTGKTSPKEGRDEARHESTAGLSDFMEAAKYLAKPSGRIVFIHHPSRLGELFRTAAGIKLAPLRLRLVHDRRDAEARMVLIELAKGRSGTLTVLPPLIVRDEGGDYSNEVERIMKGVSADA